MLYSKHKILLIHSKHSNTHTHTHTLKTTVKLGEIIAHNYLKTTAKAKAAATANKIKLSSKQTDCISLMKQLRRFSCQATNEALENEVIQVIYRTEYDCIQKN